MRVDVWRMAFFVNEELSIFGMLVKTDALAGTATQTGS
jgi:hypothetical protein